VTFLGGSFRRVNANLAQVLAQFQQEKPGHGKWTTGAINDRQNRQDEQDENSVNPSHPVDPVHPVY
jgi:hypothetical protein